ncbi:hypothetical protein [Streptacidiphilus sp. MAP12-33]|uniref:hypothetical protein n=1 Tax=Streptacidiphilus sp. MAP12-33 TaxID=3156266 RepID=UPI003518F7F7
MDTSVGHGLGKLWPGTLPSDPKGGVPSNPWDASQAGHTASIVLNRVHSGDLAGPTP